jgi:hypothetical protein
MIRINMVNASSSFICDYTGRISGEPTTSVRKRVFAGLAISVDSPSDRQDDQMSADSRGSPAEFSLAK